MNLGRSGSMLVAALLVVAAAVGCGRAGPPASVPSTAPAAGPASHAGPAPAGTATRSAPPGALPSGTGPGRTAGGSGVIGLADPGAGRVAGAELGPAFPAPAASIRALAPPTGRGALPRGTRSPVIFHGPRDRMRIALTFDSNMTDAMLRRLAAGTVTSYANVSVVDELQRTHTAATFFLAGKWVEAYPALTRRIAADPEFELASHSWAHEGFRPGCYGLGALPATAMAADVERSFQILARFSDHPSRYFRFPGGCYDDTALAAVAPTGCTVVEYDDVSGDAFGTDPTRIAARTVARARPGSIVVLHITEANARFTAVALPTIIRQLRARGFQLVTVGDLLS